MHHSLSGIEVLGVDVQPDTRCGHYHSPRDIVAIRFKCCNRYFSCHACHAELTDHTSVVWSTAEYHEKAILCGACGMELTIAEYLGCHSACPRCEASFNPGCESHYYLYFDIET